MLDNAECYNTTSNKNGEFKTVLKKLKTFTIIIFEAKQFQYKIYK